MSRAGGTNPRAMAGQLGDDASEVDLSAELQKFEEIYLKECAKARPAPEAKFNYAWALIRSPARPDIRKGVIMMSGLLEDRFSDRDCLYYMAHGHYRLDDVVEARRCLDRLLKISPNCRQAISLRDVVDDKIAKDGLIGVGLVGAAGVVLSGIVVALATGLRGSGSR